MYVWVRRRPLPWSYTRHYNFYNVLFGAIESVFFLSAQVLSFSQQWIFAEATKNSWLKTREAWLRGGTIAAAASSLVLFDAEFEKHFFSILVDEVFLKRNNLKFRYSLVMLKGRPNRSGPASARPGSA